MQSILSAARLDQEADVLESAHLNCERNSGDQIHVLVRWACDLGVNDAPEGNVALREQSLLVHNESSGALTGR